MIPVGEKGYLKELSWHARRVQVDTKSVPLGQCSGCELSVVDLHKPQPKAFEGVRVIFIRISTEGCPREHLDVIAGAFHTEHDVDCSPEVRKSCGSILGISTCAVRGGPLGPCNPRSSNALVRATFLDTATTIAHLVVERFVRKLLADGVRPFDSESEVDSCPSDRVP
jgi:coenzyme F420-reducing hydrogenase gamma subunit